MTSTFALFAFLTLAGCASAPWVAVVRTVPPKFNIVPAKTLAVIGRSKTVEDQKHEDDFIDLLILKLRKYDQYEVKDERALFRGEKDWQKYLDETAALGRPWKRKFRRQRRPQSRGARPRTDQRHGELSVRRKVTRRNVRAERLRALRHDRQRLAVDGGLERRARRLLGRYGQGRAGLRPLQRAAGVFAKHHRLPLRDQRHSRSSSLMSSSCSTS